MLKKLSLTALALMMSLGALTACEAAPSNDTQTNYSCRGGYCYNQNYDQNSERGDGYCGDGYCRGGRGCW